MGAGNKGRFSDRLKKIAFWKRKKNVNEDDDNDVKPSDRKDKTTHTIKRFFLIPIMLLQKKIDNPETKEDIPTKKEMASKLEKMKKGLSDNNKEEFNENKLDRKAKVQNIKNIDVVLLKQIHDNNLKKFYGIDNELDLDKEDLYNKINAFRNSNEYKTLKDYLESEKKKLNDNEIKKDITQINKDDKNVYGRSVNLRKDQLEREILNLLKKDLVKQINELEILQSDLYILKELENDDLVYKKCSQNIVEIKKILSRIKSLKEKYDYLKDNVDFEYMLEVKDAPLYDKIIDLKNILETDKVPFLVDDYKLLEEFKYLYLKIDKIKSDAEEYEEKKNKKIEELKKRDIDFEKFKEQVNNVSSLNEGYEHFIKEQDQIIKNMDENISKIDSIEKVSYSFKGFGSLLGNSFRYLGLLLMSPFKGLFPNIAIQTLATRRILGDLSDALKIEEKRYTVYEAAVDYSKEIDMALYDIDYTTSLIDNSLSDIIKLKANFKDKFQKYHGNFREYQDAIKKLNKIENTIMNNKIKVGLIKDKMLINEKINSQKMAKVLKLNENSQ